MSEPAEFLRPSEAARRLGVSTKALRIYEARGLVAPIRSAAGWRAYGPDQMARGREIAALRSLGLSLAQISRVLAGEATDLDLALSAHQAKLEGQMRCLAGTIDKIRSLRAVQPDGSVIGELTQMVQPATEIAVAFDLPWPWGGERFELRNIRPLTYIAGPLGSGKTRFAMRIAEHLPAVFVGLDRATASIRSRLELGRSLAKRVAREMQVLVEDGATASDALLSLVVNLEDDGLTAIVVDMVEQGLDQDTQEALIAYLRRGARRDRPLFLMTRSSSILDLGAVGPDEAIVLCPANHSPPMRVAPYPGAPGYEALASCLAPPEVRARTEGVIAWRPEVA